MYGVLYGRENSEVSHTSMKRTEIKRRPLADTVLTSLEPESTEYRESYGADRLYFVVSPSGRKRWELRYKKPSGAWSFLGLGAYPEVTAKKAREKAQQSQALVSDGVDPVAHKAQAKGAKAAASANTFRVAAEEWYQRKVEDGRSDSTLDKIRTYLDKDILPALGDKLLPEISRQDCADLQARIEERSAFNVAKKVRGWLKQIFSQAIARGKCENNPASELLTIAAEAPPVKHYPHLLEPALPQFLSALRGTTSRMVARVAAWLVLRTASRPGMVRFAEWDDIDLDNGLWSLSAQRMKMRRDHIVPLPSQAVADLRELKRLTGSSRWVFPGSGPKHPTISENTINQVFSKIGYKGQLVGHGTRHTASTLLREHGWAKDHVEAQLAHIEEGVSGVYNKAQYLAQRTRMMQWYSDYLDALEAGLTDEQRSQFAEAVNR